MAEKLARIAGLEAVLVIWTPSVAFAPTSTVPKLSAAGARTMVGGLETPTSEMNSSDVLALEEISIAPTRAAGLVPGWAEGCGVKVMVRVQLAPGTMMEQLLATVKSGVD